MNYFIILAIVIPFLFLVGVIYNALKEQKRLESETLPKFLAQRQAQGNPYAGDAYADEDEDDYGTGTSKNKGKVAAPPQSLQAQQNAQKAATADLVASIAAAIGTAGVAEAQEALSSMQNAQDTGKGGAHIAARQLTEEQTPSRAQEGQRTASDSSNDNSSHRVAMARHQSNNATDTTFSEDSPLLAAVRDQPLGESNLDADSAAAYFARYHATSDPHSNAG